MAPELTLHRGGRHPGGSAGDRVTHPRRAPFAPPAPTTQGRPPTGEEVLREGARMLAEFFMQRLTSLPETDPYRFVIEDLAGQHRDLADQGPGPTRL